MKRPVQVILLVLSGLGLLHASLFTDLCLRYVKEGMRPMLIASGALLLLLGVADAVAQWWPGGRDGHAERHEHGGGEDHGHGHDHSATPRVAWLLFLPALSLLFYAPPALGAYTASREAPKAVTEREHFDPLPATSPVPMTLSDFTSRVQQDREQAIKGRSVRMTGFVTPDKGSGGWYLTRLIFNCCAADAQSVKVRMYGTAALPANTWVTVTGTWHPGGTLGTGSAPVALDARTVEKVDRPVNAYSDALPLPSSR
ncbi:TIGR03943 family putative permease subunit [Streptomyces yaanensis]|uniref:TIGR03943 family putative permease subunit n=1 Tax=Streptomyces yaanensis TaxID=1142239 RepID=A0ABV7S9K9_9ACTN|nr:TIGR03943 family protein [Streptomyces sp. CGMCC 4.7035]WNB96679.1 TIGR03943 family protein [Streptomyces sp. CGMCC 4.7035]